MEEQTPQPLTTPVASASSSPGGPEDKSSTLFIVIGIVVLIIIFAVAVFVLSYNNQPVTNQQPTQSQNAPINSTADLDRVTRELDNTNLDNYESELKQNDLDSSEF